MAQQIPPPYPGESYYNAPPAQPYMYPPQTMAQPTQTVIIVDDRQGLLQPQQMIWGELPQRCLCQFCGKQVVSTVVYEPGTLTWLVAGGLCLVGCWLGCCLVPFAVDSMKDPVHICPHCNHQIGRKSRI